MSDSLNPHDSEFNAQMDRVVEEADDPTLSSDFPRQQAQRPNFSAGQEVDRGVVDDEPVDPRPLGDEYAVRWGVGTGKTTVPQTLPAPLAMASMLLGLVCLLLSWVPLIGYVFSVLGVVAIVLGVISLAKENAPFTAVVGIVLGVLSVLVTFLVHSVLRWIYSALSSLI